MAKIRVYELAKKLDIQSKDIIGYLAENGMEVKSQSGLDDAQTAMITKKFGKQEPAQGKAAPEKASAEKAASAKTAEHAAPGNPESEAKKKAANAEAKKEAPAASDGKGKEKRPAAGDGRERPRKKPNISAVFNAQYSRQPRSRRPEGERRNARPGDRGARPGGNRSGRPGDRSVRSQEVRRPLIRPLAHKEGERPSDRFSVKEEPQSAQQTPRQNVSAQRPQQPREAQPKDRELQANAANSRPQQPRENVYANRRPQERSEQAPRRENVYANRDDRRPRTADNRDARKPRSGEGRNFTSRPGRPAVGQNVYANSRDNKKGGARPGGDRDFRKNDRKGAAAVPAEEIRGKESRERDNNRRKKHDRDVLGSKKQERYVNLEKNGGKKKNKAPAPKQPARDENEILTITLPEKITIRDLADKLKVQASDIVKKLFMKGVMVTVNHDIDYEQAEEIALEYNCICEPEEKVDVIEELLREDEDPEESLVPRPPVVCVMGHVDHGKTSLLDAIRDTHVTDREAGGITQHIGAYVVDVNGQKITFLDTPGHEAFTAMRMRGANSTDIAILVVAADDGVMPQTVEAINHAKAAGIEIIVAINKIDKPNANVERVKQELSEYQLIPEDWGGNTIFVPVSAHTREGIDTLLEMILLTAEMCELKANPNRNARGLVIEAQLDKGRGAVATVLVQKGTLHVGDPVAAGSSHGKVRAMLDHNGRRVKEAGPSTPVEILGLSDVPNAGEIFVAMDSEKEARNFAETFISEGKNRLIEETKAKMSLDDLFSQIQSGNVKELNIIVKADVQGSVEAVKQSLEKLSNEEVVVKIIHGGVGAINESDVILASASNAIIIGFNVRPDAVAKATADREGVDVRLYKVIYNAIEDVAAAMKGMLDPVYEEKVIGHAVVRQIFKASDVGNIAGSYVLDGYFQRNCKVRVFREGEQLFEGELASLKRFKDDVKEVKAGYECGLVIEGFNDIAEEDTIEAYIMVEVPR